MTGRNPLEREEVLFSKEGLHITNRAIIYLGEAFPLEEAKSIRVKKAQPWVASLILGGLGFMLIYFGSFGFGLACFAIVAALWYFKKDKGRLEIHHLAASKFYDVTMPFVEAKEAAEIIEKQKIEVLRLKHGAPPRQKEEAPQIVASAASDQERFNLASAEFKRLATQAPSGDEMAREFAKIQQLVAADCEIPGPYIFVAEKLALIQGAAGFEVIMSALEKGHRACLKSSDFQQEVENAFFGIGKFFWDNNREDLAFRSYMAGLTRWREAGNTISQSSPLSPRIAFVASRMFSKNALERDNNAALGVELLDFCEASGVDINLQIDVSDARSTG